MQPAQGLAGLSDCESAPRAGVLRIPSTGSGGVCVGLWLGKWGDKGTAGGTGQRQEGGGEGLGEQT